VPKRNSIPICTGARLCPQDQSQRVNYGCGLENCKQLMAADVLRLGFQPQPRSGEKPVRADIFVETGNLNGSSSVRSGIIGKSAQNMSLLTELEWIRAINYKDSAPTVLCFL
jgi:hypothetical protein